MIKLRETGQSDAEGLLQQPGAVSEAACRKGALILAFLFFLLYLPSLSSLSHWRGDERFYTDAAVAMQQSGDYLTPVYPDGSLRFKKPIVSYWGVLYGFKVFGFNYFGARVAFLTAGALVVWLSFELCLTLVRRRPDLALVATAIVASNLTMHNTSIRSTPDMLVCLFVLLSLLGFSNLFFNERRPHWYALAFLGSGLAMATKGLSGLLPVLYAFLYAVLSRRPDLRIRRLLHPVFAPLAVALGSGWFIWAFWRYGAVAAADFFGDQVGERLSGTKTYILVNAGTYLSSFLIQLLPWAFLALLVFAVQRQAVLQTLRQHRKPLVFAGGWILFLFVIFSCGNLQRTRYFLPAYPFLALFFAFPLLQETSDAKSKSMVNRALRLLFGFATVGGAVLVVFGFTISTNLAIAGIVIAGVGLVMAKMSSPRPAPQRLAAAAAFIILMFAVNGWLIEPLFNVSAAPEITRRLLAGAPAKLILPMSAMDGEASQIRVLSGGKIDPRIVSARECDRALRTHGVLICTERVLNGWQPANAEAELLATGSDRWKLRDYIALFRADNRPAFLQSKRVACYLVSDSSIPLILDTPNPSAGESE
jgi:4-amino-4-deoxy-L-arabinose transferase-like glycosyltransferase